VISPKWCATSGAVARPAASVAAPKRPSHPRARRHAAFVGGARCGASRRANSPRAVTEAKESWNETSSSTSGERSSSTSADAAMLVASANDRPHSPAPSATAAISAERSVATASPVSSVYSNTAGSATAAATRPAPTRSASPGTAAAARRTTKKIRAATEAR
jgi:hypothetical protein